MAKKAKKVERDDDGDDEPSKPVTRSQSPGVLQRGVESIARGTGSLQPSRAWEKTKDISRAVVPAQLEALARNKLRGENYEDAKAKAEEGKEKAEGRNPASYLAAQAVGGTVGAAAGIAGFVGAQRLLDTPGALAAKAKSLGKFGAIAGAAGIAASLVQSAFSSSAAKADGKRESDREAQRGAGLAAAGANAAPPAVGVVASVRAGGKIAAANQAKAAAEAAKVSQAKAVAGPGKPDKNQRSSYQTKDGRAVQVTQAQAERYRGQRKD